MFLVVMTAGLQAIESLENSGVRTIALVVTVVFKEE